VVSIKDNNLNTTWIGGGSRRRTSSTTQEQMEVVTRAARTTLDWWMLRAIVAARTSRLPWRRSNLTPRAATSLLARRGAPLARLLWEYRRLGALGMPLLARTGDRHRSPSGSGSHRHRATDLGAATTTTLDRGTATIACPGRVAAATAATGRGSTAMRTLGQPPPSHAPGWEPSLMNQDGAWKIESWHSGSSFIDARTWSDSTGLHRLTWASFSYWKPRDRNIQYIYTPIGQTNMRPGPQY
jgi:hypothetical protein